MNPQEELKRFAGFCGAYCKKCPWFTGELRDIFKKAEFALKEYGLERRLEEIDVENFKKGLEILKNLRICSGCKQEIKEGVIKFGCIENLKEIKEKGISEWFEKQW